MGAMRRRGAGLCLARQLFIGGHELLGLAQLDFSRFLVMLTAERHNIVRIKVKVRSSYMGSDDIRFCAP